jgi:hypothetical protein
MSGLNWQATLNVRHIAQKNSVRIEIEGGSEEEGEGVPDLVNEPHPMLRRHPLAEAAGHPPLHQRNGHVLIKDSQFCIWEAYHELAAQCSTATQNGASPLGQT